ncbi:ionotropic receptor 75a-like [Bicyclus anynana]|uniref:Ionotropic receptor 75a-like n=1 Tax=Bicyclus anynana TaxID=110368 RepID=A0ABM3LTA7_BICAN|nr:ionotropic receptor 75a-like [Bicyclus anynana]
MCLMSHVGSLFTCESVGKYENLYEYDPLWRQSFVGCIMLNILQDMFKFNLGFILRHRYSGVFKAFYSLPFSTTVWLCIYGSMLFGSICLYVLSKWDTSVFGGECSFAYELLLAFSAYCQHILPLQATSNSRRIGYLTFIVCAYVVHSFYTSNLLSHLVSDRGKAMDLNALVESDYQFALLKDMNLDTDRRKYEKSMDNNLSIVWKKLLQVHIMNLTAALDAVIYTKTALLTEYYTIYPCLRKYLDSEDICQLVEIDLYSKVKQFFFTNKSFLYKEEFKIGALRAKEAGLMTKIFNIEKFSPLKCDDSRGDYKSQFEHAVSPIIILFASYMLAVLVLIGERLHHRLNRVFPYVE